MHKNIHVYINKYIHKYVYKYASIYTLHVYAYMHVSHVHKYTYVPVNETAFLATTDLRLLKACLVRFNRAWNICNAHISCTVIISLFVFILFNKY